MQNLASLVKDAYLGDTGAFEDIVERFPDMTCGQAYSILGDFQLVEVTEAPFRHRSLAIQSMPITGCLGSSINRQYTNWMVE